MCTLRLQASTLLSLLYVHPWTTTIHSCIITVCAYLDYSHPILYHYFICGDYRHILFYHYRMCTLRLQPSTLVSILYAHPWTTPIHSCIITVFAYTTGTYSFIITICTPSDYSHPLSYHNCMCRVAMAIRSCIITVRAYWDYSHLLLCH